jgi:uncharacterized protein
MIPILIYLHGFATGPNSKKAQFFKRNVESLGYDIVVPDLAQGDFEHLTISGQLGVVERISGGKPVTLIGSSMGAYVAALFAARHAEVRHLILMAPAFDFIRRWPESLGAARMERWRASGSMPVYHYADQRERELSYRIIEDAVQYPDSPTFPQPALLFHGVRDSVVPYDLSVRFAATHPHARLVLTNSDHELINALEMIWDRSRSFLFNK